MQPSWVHQPVCESRAARAITDLTYQAPVGIHLDDPSTMVNLARKRQDDEEHWSVQEWAKHTAGWTAESQAFASRLLASSPERREEFIAFAHHARDDRHTDRNRYDYYEFLISMARLSDKALGRLVQSFSAGETPSSTQSAEPEEKTDFGIWHDAEAERRYRLDKYFPDDESSC